MSSGPLVSSHNGGADYGAARGDGDFVVPIIQHHEPVQTPAEKRKVCVKVGLASVGFCLDSYDFFVMNVVLKIMAAAYGSPTNSQAGFVASMALWGALCGQILFGSLADRLGRRMMFVTTCILTILGSLSSALCFPDDNFSIYWQLGICRFFLGLGVGGEYPLSATVANEASSGGKSKGRMTVIVFSMQGVGALLAPSLSSVLLVAGTPNDVAWRLLLGLAVIPMTIILPFRWRMEESTEYKAALEARARAKLERSDFDPVGHGNAAVVAPGGGVGGATAATAVGADGVPLTLLGKLNKYKYMMIGTAGTWFLLDVVFYANSLFNSDITKALGFGSSPLQASVSALALASVALPGYFLSVCFMDKVGRKLLQLLGFVVVGTLFFVMASQYRALLTQPTVFLLLYGLSFLFSNFGPNATTYTIAAEIYPAAVRFACRCVLQMNMQL